MLANTTTEKWLRGPVGFALISTMHIVVIYLLATALGKSREIDLPIPAIKLIFENTKIVDPPPPVIGPNSGDATVVKLGPAPNIPDATEEDSPKTDPGPTEPVDTSGSGVIEPAVVGPRADPRHPLTQPEYPASDIRKGNEGRVLIRLRLGRDGRVLAATVVRSSGFPGLDRAAVQTALRDWQLLPARQGDVPVEGHFETWVRFSLTDR